MARRSKEQMRAEFDRLDQIFRFQVAFQKPWQPEIEDWIPTKAQMLARVEAGNARMSDLTAGTRQAINDFSEMLVHWIADGNPMGQTYLDAYQRHFARAYFDDVGHPARLAKSILRRGVIRSETEYQMLTGILADVDQKTLSEDQVAKANQLIMAFDSEVMPPKLG